MEQLNDPFEGICLFQQNDLEGCSEKEDVKQDKIKEITNNLVGKYISENIFETGRISCFTTDTEHSKGYCNELLWAHYADSHRGVCIKYKWEDVNDICDRLASINYESFCPPISGINDEDIMKCIYSKSKEWSYENEVRAYLKAKKIGELTQFSPEKIRDNLIYDEKYFYCMEKKGKYNVIPKQIKKKCKPIAIYCGLKITSDNFEKIKDICKDNDIQLYKMEQEKLNYSLNSKRINWREGGALSLWTDLEKAVPVSEFCKGLK